MAVMRSQATILCVIALTVALVAMACAPDVSSGGEGGAGGAAIVGPAHPAPTSATPWWVDAGKD